MEGVTDAPVRALLSERGGFTHCVSEFLRVSQNVPPPRIYREHVPELNFGCVTPGGTPVGVQLLGGDPERLARSAALAIELGATAIDLNFGCPAPTVNRHDGGATLLKYPERIRGIVAAVRAAVPAPYPVSAKLRLGWEDISDIHRNAEMAAEGGASWLTIHARTRMQGYAPPVYWKPIGEIRARLNLPVVANGDIWTFEDFLRCREMTECAHYMIGRSALADPALPLRIARELGLSAPVGNEDFHECPARPSAAWLGLFFRYQEICRENGRDNKPGFLLARIKQWLNLARRGRALPWWDDIKRCRTAEELFATLESLAIPGKTHAIPRA